MEQEITIDLRRDDGTSISLIITPQYTDHDGSVVANEVYELTSDALD